MSDHLDLPASIPAFGRQDTVGNPHGQKSKEHEHTHKSGTTQPAAPGANDVQVSIPGDMSRMSSSNSDIPEWDPFFGKQVTLQDAHGEALEFASPSDAAALPAVSQAGDGLQVEDLISMTRLGAPAVSPNQQIVAFSVKELDDPTKQYNKESNNWTTSLYMSDMREVAHKFEGEGKDEGKEQQQQQQQQAFPALSRITNAVGKSDHDPVWLDDANIAFLSNRSGSSQVWVINVGGGEAYPLTTYPVAVNTFKLSHSRNLMAFTCDVYPGLNGAMEGILGATAKKIKQDEDNKVGENYKHYTKLYVRSWDQWDTPLKSHVLAASLRKRVNGRWVVSGGDSGYADVMTGVDAHCPIPPFRGVEDYDVSADGQEIAFSAYLCNESKIAWGTNVDVYRVGVTACQEGVISVGAPKNISAPNPGYDCNPVFSYDGKSIAWFSMQEPGNESDQNRVMIYDRATATATRVADDWTLSPHAMVWTPNNQSLLLTAQEKGRVRVFKCPVTSSSSSSPSPSAAPVAVCGTSAVGGVATLGSNAVVFLQSSMSAPSELYVCRAASAEEGNMAVALTNFNGRRLKKIVRSTAEEFYFKGADDEDVHAWFLKPVGFDEDAKDKWPLACVIHGGPQGAINDSWHYRWNPQTLTAAGFAVVAINFHGSTGYGQAFTDSISKEWGTKPFDDIMKGMDATLEKFAWLDKEKTVALGASYGGFMINWINGHTDRFKALVNHDGVFNQPAMYYTTDELFFCEHEFGGVPWESDLYNKFSPHEFVKNWKTPCLVIHGAKDYRVPLTEGLATFTALQRRGIPSEFLMFPEENHWVLQLDNSIVWHKHVLAWLQRFTN